MTIQGLAIKRFTFAASLWFMTIAAQGQTVPITTVIQCEDFSENRGGWYPEPPPAHEQRVSVKYLGSGDWIRFDSVNLVAGQFDSVSFYYVGWSGRDWSTAGHQARLKLDSPQGTDIAVFPLTNTFNGAARPSAQALSPTLTGFHTLYLTFDGDDTVCSVADRIVLSGHATVNASEAATYYVAPYGDDGNNGLSVERPFKTIQQAANVMKPGSVCNIRQGIYRETVTPRYTGSAGAPLTFQTWNNESVYISGADLVTGWTPYSGSIYKAMMSWTMGKYKNQLFVDGATAIVARSPNINDPQPLPRDWSGMYPAGLNNMVALQNEIHPFLAPTRVYFWGQSDAFYGQNGHMKQGATEYTSQNFIPSYMLGKPVDFYKGGLLSLQNGWWVNVAEIQGSTPAPSDIAGFYLTSESINKCGFEGNHGPGYISHLLSLLDQPNEWFRDSAGTVYLWAPDGGDPSHHLVEAKRRLTGFDLTSRSHVTLKGLRFLGTSATLEDAWYCTIDDCHWKYPSYYDAYEWWEEFGGPNWFGSPYDPSDGFSGVFIGGGYNTVRNSSSVISAGSGFILSGRGHHTITNCIARDCNWLPTYNAGIRQYVRDWSSSEDCGGNLIEYNTVYNCGRSTIELDGGSSVQGEHTRIMHNDLGRCGWLANEVTSVGAHAIRLVEIAYNRFHSVCGGSQGFTGADATWGCFGYKIHHNVFYRGRPIYDAPMNKSACDWVLGAGDTAVRVFNNTCVDTVSTPVWDLYPLENFPAKCFANNIMWNAGNKTRWKFTDPARDDYTLQAGSPAIDSGVEVPGWIGPGDYGGPAPDMGAFEFGKPAWRAGADWQERPWVYPPAPVSSVMPGVRNATAMLRPRLLITPQRFVVTAPMGQSYTVRLFDAQGHVRMAAEMKKGGVWNASTAQMTSGMYFIRVSSNGGTITHRAPLCR